MSCELTKHSCCPSKTPNQMNKLVIPLLKGNLLLLESEKVKYLESDGPVVYLWDHSDKSYASNKSLKYFEALFQKHNFFKFSQSLLVNVDNLYYFDQTSQEIELVCGKKLHMSRRGMRRFKEYVCV